MHEILYYSIIYMGSVKSFVAHAAKNYILMHKFII